MKEKKSMERQLSTVEEEAKVLKTDKTNLIENLKSFELQMNFVQEKNQTLVSEMKCKQDENEQVQMLVEERERRIEELSSQIAKKEYMLVEFTNKLDSLQLEKNNLNLLIHTQVY